MKRRQEALAVYEAWVNATVNQFSPSNGSAAIFQHTSAFKSWAILHLEPLANAAEEKLGPLELQPSFNHHASTVYNFLASSQTHHCFRNLHMNYVMQIPYKSYLVRREVITELTFQISGLSPSAWTRVLYERICEVTPETAACTYGGGPAGKSPTEVLDITRQAPVVRNLTLALHGDIYTGVAVLYTIAGILLGLCAIRSLLRHFYSGFSSRMWPHFAQLGLGAGLALLILLDNGISNPDKSDYWDETTTPKFDTNWYEASRLFKLSEAGWPSAIVFLVYVTAAGVTSWASVSVGLRPSSHQISLKKHSVKAPVVSPSASAAAPTSASAQAGSAVP